MKCKDERVHDPGGGERKKHGLTLIECSFLFRPYMLASHLHNMNGGNRLDSIMRRVKLTEENRTSKGTPCEFDREHAPSSVLGSSKCVVEEIYEDISQDIIVERGSKVMERQGGDTTNATPDIKEGRGEGERV